MLGRRGNGYSRIGENDTNALSVKSTTRTKKVYGCAVAGIIIAVVGLTLAVVGLIIASVSIHGVTDLQQKGIKGAKYEIGNNGQNQVCLTGSTSAIFGTAGNHFDDAVECLDADHQFVYGNRQQVNTFYAPFDGVYRIDLAIQFIDPSGCDFNSATQAVIGISAPNGPPCGATTNGLLSNGDYASVSCTMRLAQNQTVSHFIRFTPPDRGMRIQDDSYFSIFMLSPLRGPK